MIGTCVWLEASSKIAYLTSFLPLEPPVENKIMNAKRLKILFVKNRMNQIP